MRRIANSGLIALAVYALVSFVLFGLRVTAAPATAHIGLSKDPSLMMWCMAWWPHAIAHGLNPFVTRSIWAPLGYNLTWVTSIPAIAIVSAPITAAFGPVVSYNLAALLAPALSAWAAFLLCRHVTRHPIAAFAGGLLYGFSPYEVGQVLAGHLHLTPAFIPPLCALLVIAAVEERINRRAFTAALTGLIMIQCLISTEVLATMTLFGAAAVVAALGLIPAARGRLLTVSLRIGMAYAAASLMLAPFLCYALAAGAVPKDGFFPSTFFSADLLSFVVPGPLMLVQTPGAAMLTAGLDGNVFENGSYFGIPLLIIAAAYFWPRRSQPPARLLAILLAMAMVAALGPIMHFDGHAIAVLPWSAIEHLPLIRYALPVRFVNYGFLVLGLILSLSLSDSKVRFATPLIAAAFAALLPNPLLLCHESHYPNPPFFARGIYRQYLKPQENVLVIPYGISGASMLWQAESWMYFNMPGGYTGLTPEQFQKWPLLNTLINSIPVAQQSRQLSAFARAHQVDAILIADGTSASAGTLPAALGAQPVKVGGVSLYRLPHDSTKYPSADDIDTFQRQSAALWFGELLCAAGHFLQSGHHLAALNPVNASRMGLLPESQWSGDLALLLAGFANGSNNGLWIGPGADGTVAIGLPASPAAARAIAARYGASASTILYPYPARYGAGVPAVNEVHFLLTTVALAELSRCPSDYARRWTTASR